MIATPRAAGGAALIGADDPELPGWRRAPATPDQRRADALGAVGLFLLSMLSLALTRAAGMFGPDLAPLPLAVALLAAITLPLAVRRRWPVAVLAVVTVAFVVAGEVVIGESTLAQVSLFCALYTVGAWEGNRRLALWARGATVAVMAVWFGTGLFRTTLAELDAELAELAEAAGIGALTPAAAFILIQLLINILYFAGAWWFGTHAWNAARGRALLEYRTAQLQSEQQVVARQAVTIERFRIARELHDAVAHHVSLMGVQAAAARTALPRDPAATERQLLALEESARSAVAELYDLLGTLREEPDPTAPPGEAALADPAAALLDLAAVPDLVADAARAGLDVSLEVVGEPRPVPPVVELNLYRVGQEALTNVVKHAGPGTKTSVRVRYLADQVEIEIADDGRGRPAPRSCHGGLGLVGMRERVGAMRGDLVARPRPAGGFLVRAAVPVGPAYPAPAAPTAPAAQEEES